MAATGVGASAPTLGDRAKRFNRNIMFLFRVEEEFECPLTNGGMVRWSVGEEVWLNIGETTGGHIIDGTLEGDIAWEE